MRLLLVIGDSLLIVDLIMKDKEELISSWIIHGSNIWVLEHSFLKNLPQHFFIEEFVVLSLKNLIFGQSLFRLDTFIDAVGFYQLLERFQLHGPLSVFNWQSTKWVELWILEFSYPERF